jgi:phage FluMu gp28-like protein
MTESEARAQVLAEDRLTWVRSFVDIPMASGDPETTGLNPNQIRCIGDFEPYQAVEKGRQQGHSFAFALDSIARAVLEPRSQAVHISTDKWEAQKKQIYCLRILDALKNEVKPYAKVNSESKVRIEFSNGSLIDFLACRPPRGADRGGIYLDEMAFMPSVQEILKAALGCTLHGGYLRAGSTHCGALTEFFKIVRNEMDEWGNHPYAPWSRGYFPWWTCPNLCNDVVRAIHEAPNLPTHERVEKFGKDNIKKIFKGYPLLSEFQEEFECMVVDEAHAFFPMSLLERCAPPKGADEWFEQTEPEIRGGADMERAKALIRMLGKAYREGYIKGTLHAAWDIGRHVDRSEITIGSHDRSNMTLRGIISMANVPFEKQQDLFEYMLAEIPIVTSYIDATPGSAGDVIGEKMFAKYGQRAMPFVFNMNSKAFIANGGKIMMEKGQFIIPVPLPRLLRQFHSIKKKVSVSGNHAIFDIEANKEHHGDLAWSALMLMSLAGTSDGVMSASPIEVIQRVNPYAMNTINVMGVPLIGGGISMAQLLDGLVTKRPR